MRDGRPSGDWEVFADGFAGIDPIPNTSDAVARPMGLAQGPDGSLYVSDSAQGRIWKIRYRGTRATFGEADLAAMAARKASQAHLRQPDEVKDIIGGPALAEGGQLYQTYCVACHQADGKGDGARFPSLQSTRWVSGNKPRLISAVLFGLSGEIEVEGRTWNGVMPANGFLTDDQVAKLLTYLRQSFGNLGQGVSAEEVAQQRAKGPWTPPPTR